MVPDVPALHPHCVHLCRVLAVVLLTALLLPASGSALRLSASMITADADGNALDHKKPDAQTAHRRLLSRFSFRYTQSSFTCRACTTDDADASI